nr:putative retrotransposon protein [Tanacetum cinerariifolium]
MTFKKYLSDAQRLTTYKEMRRMGKVLYASAIGSIMYVMTCTRPDVTYVLSITSRFQYDLGEEHWTAVKTIQSLQNVEVIKVHTNDNTDDPLTKALPYDKHEFRDNGMGPRYIRLE